MELAGSKKLVITSDALKYAKLISSPIDTEFQRKRAFASIVALDACADFLVTKKIKVNITKSLFKIAPVNEEFEFSDMYYNDWKMDVRLVVDEDFVTIPKSHFKYDIQADLYIVIKVDKMLEKASLLGFVEKDSINKTFDNGDYYLVNLESLSSPDALVDKLKKENPNHMLNENHFDFESSYLAYLDGTIDTYRKKTFIKHVAQCTACRSDFVEFYDFETIVKNLENKPEFFEDRTLDVFGATALEDAEISTGEELVIDISDDIEDDNDSDGGLLDDLFSDPDNKVENVEENLSSNSDDTDKKDSSGALGAVGAVAGAVGLVALGSAASAAVEPVKSALDTTTAGLNVAGATVDAAAKIAQAVTPQVVLPRGVDEALDMDLSGEQVVQADSDIDFDLDEVSDDSIVADIDSADDLPTIDLDEPEIALNLDEELQPIDSAEDFTDLEIEDEDKDQTLISDEEDDFLNIESGDDEVQNEIDAEAIDFDEVTESEEENPEPSLDDVFAELGNDSVEEEPEVIQDDLVIEDNDLADLIIDSDEEIPSSDEIDLDFDSEIEDEAQDSEDDSEEEVISLADSDEDEGIDLIVDEVDASSDILEDLVVDEATEAPLDDVVDEEYYDADDEDALDFVEPVAPVVDEISDVDIFADMHSSITEEPEVQDVFADIDELPVADEQSDELSFDDEGVDLALDYDKSDLSVVDTGAIDSVSNDGELKLKESADDSSLLFEDECDEKQGLPLEDASENVEETKPAKKGFFDSLSKIEAEYDDYRSRIPENLDEVQPVEDDDLFWGSSEKVETPVASEVSQDDELVIDSADESDFEPFIEPEEVQETPVDSEVGQDDELVIDSADESDFETFVEPEEVQETSVESDLSQDDELVIDTVDESDFEPFVEPEDVQETPVDSEVSQDDELVIDSADESDFEPFIEPEEVQETPVDSEVGQEDELIVDSSDESGFEPFVEPSLSVEEPVSEFNSFINSGDDSIAEINNEVDSSNNLISLSEPFTDEDDLDQTNLKLLYETNTPDKNVTENTEEQVEYIINKNDNLSIFQDKKTIVITSCVVACLFFGAVFGITSLTSKTKHDSDSSDIMNGQVQPGMGPQGENPTMEPIPMDPNAVNDPNNEQAVAKSASPDVHKDMNKAMSNVFADTPTAVSITKISWEVPQSLASSPVFAKYLQEAGKSIQLNLKNDLLNATEAGSSDKIKVNIVVDSKNQVKKLTVLNTSGSQQIDNIVLQSIKQTLKYVVVPQSGVSAGLKQNLFAQKSASQPQVYDLKLVINF